MKKIRLTQNKIALVDDEDFEWLNQYKWYAQKGCHTFYAIRTIYKNNKPRTVRMHREILGLFFGDGLKIDHKNHNGLNNQKKNLRFATRSQNAMNQKIRITTSNYKGVSWHKGNKKWIAYIKINGKRLYLGLFNNEVEAAKIYDKEAKQLFGEYANINFRKER